MERDDVRMSADVHEGGEVSDEGFWLSSVRERRGEEGGWIGERSVVVRWDESDGWWDCWRSWERGVGGGVGIESGGREGGWWGVGRREERDGLGEGLVVEVGTGRAGSGPTSEGSIGFVLGVEVCEREERNGREISLVVARRTRSVSRDASLFSFPLLPSSSNTPQTPEPKEINSHSPSSSKALSSSKWFQLTNCVGTS